MSTIEALLTVREVAAYLACAEETVKRLVRRGHLPATRIGTRLRFARADVEAYRAAHRTPVRIPLLSQTNAHQQQTMRPPPQEHAPHSAAAYLTRLQLVTGVFTQLHTPAQAAEVVISQCVRALDASSGLVSLVRDDQTLELVHAVGYLPNALTSWQRLPLDVALPLPDVVRSKEPRFFETVTALVAHYPQLIGDPTSAAWALIPLPVDDDVIGGIVLAFDAPRLFTLDERAFLLALGQQCAQAIERARLYAAERAARAAAEEAQSYATLLAETTQLFATMQLDLNAVLAQVVRRIAEVIGDGCGVRLLSDDGQFLLPSMLYNSDPAAQQLLAELDNNPYPVGVGLTGQVATTGQPLFMPEIDPSSMQAQIHPAYNTYVDLFPIYSLMIVPLLVRDRVIGVLNVSRGQPGHPYSETDLQVLSDLADRAALAINNAQLFQQAQQQAARIQTLADASRVFAEAQLDVSLVLEQVAQHVAHALGDNCTIRLISADGERLEPVAVYHPDPDARALLQALASSQVHHISEGFTGRVVQSGQPLLIPIVAIENLRAQLKPEYWPYVDRIGIASILAVLLQVHGKIIGTLFVSRDAPGRPYTTEDQTFLQELADRAASAIENARLYAAEQHARSVAEQAAQRTAILQTVTAALSEPHGIEQIADMVMTKGIRALGAVAGAISLLNDDGTFSVVRMINYPTDVIEAWRGARYPTTLAAPIPDAVRTRAPIWLESTDEIMARYASLATHLPAEHIGAWATVPLIVEERVFGGISFLFAESQAFSVDDRAFILAMAQQCAQAMERARSHEAEERALAEVDGARQRLALLADASAELAMSLDVQTTLTTLAHLVVPHLADWCIVDIVADDGSIQTLVVAHANPAKEAIGWQLVRRYPINPDAPAGTALVLRTLQPELVPEITDAMLSAIALDAEHIRLLQELGIRSSLCVPLVARGRALGTIALVAAESGRRYNAADLPFVEDLARRAALAVDNARLYRESQTAVQLRDTFFSVAAHELKTPLTSLLGQAQLIQRRAHREGGLNERDQRSIRVIVNQAARLNLMILAMLDTARLEQGQLSIEHQPVELSALVERVVEEMRPTLDQHTIVLKADAGALVVSGDSLRLEQVLQNLLGNAVKYSPQGGQVRVELERDGTQVRVSVYDHGIGIPPAAIPQLFQRFYRASNVSAQHISGMGIGLYVVKEIVSLHGGTVVVESSEGHGSVFRVSLPLYAAN